ncbi:Octamer-binding transcription factor [Trema orientale]|uniref:Octamer-binding transcription factor n=1 Tax=Trema orientale TaxID=63057 RepID=A0A2P5FXL0_TREOI|nr:Octamer-binding transcription factor [Trema orientale]
MEVREQLDKDIGMRNTLDYNSPNRDSSPKLSSPVGSEKLSHGNTIIFNPPNSQTLDHHNQYNLSYHLNRPNKARTRDHHPDEPSPDPVTTVSPTSTTLVGGGANPKTPVNAAVSAAAAAAAAIGSHVRYRECLKNHAASSGGHVLDGCGEFMPSGDDGTAEAMKCAACECHRSFHRKETDVEFQYVPNYKDSSRRSSLVLPPQHYHPPPPPHRTHPHPHHHHHHHHQFALHGLAATPGSGAGPIPPVMMAFGGGGIAAESSSEDLNVFQSNYGGGGRPQQSAPASSKKRFRTKFNQEQKDKMTEFAEKLGWRIQKHDEQEVQQFCSEVGVKRQVFKVWMHNNKQAMKKKQM